jgi:5-hydroxytryptamine receptor 7
MKDQQPEQANVLFSLVQSIGYQLYATIGAFYLPLAIMIVTYTSIYLVTSRLVRQHICQRGSSSEQYQLRHLCPTSSCQRLAINSAIGRRGGRRPLAVTSLFSYLPFARRQNLLRRRFLWRTTHNNTSSDTQRQISPTSTAIAMADRKAVMTLGAIMGTFIACWLPFFVVAVARPFCVRPETCIPHWIDVTLLWLGYANSLLNPIVYVRFNRDFRIPFRHIVRCHFADINFRLRAERFAEQYHGNVNRRNPSTVADDGDGESTRKCTQSTRRCCDGGMTSSWSEHLPSLADYSYLWPDRLAPVSTPALTNLT